MRLIDCMGHPSAAGIRAAGFDGRMCYLGHDRWSKGVTPELAASYHAAGLALGFVFESVADRHMTGWFAGGQQDGADSARWLAELGVPAFVACFWAGDAGVSPARMPAVLQYAAGFRAGSQRPPGVLGAYGGPETLQAARLAGHAAHTWQGWGNPVADLCIRQGGQVSIEGIACDIDEILNPDCLWLPNPQPVPQPSRPVHFEEDNVTKLSMTVPPLDDQGNGSFVVPGMGGRVVKVFVNGNDPNAEGYNGLKPFFQVSERGPDDLVVVQGGKPHSGFDVRVWVAG